MLTLIHMYRIAASCFFYSHKICRLTWHGLYFSEQ